MSDCSLKTRAASKHLNASLQFFKPRPNLPFELNKQANEWYTVPALRNSSPAVFSCQRVCRLRISGLFFRLYGWRLFSNEGTTACGGLELDVSPTLVVGDWDGEEEHSDKGLLLRTSSCAMLSDPK